VRLSDRGNRPVTLLHVVDGPGLGEHSIRGWLGTHEYHRGVGTDALKKLRFLIPPPDRGAVMARVAVGNPVREIIETARSLKAQLIVIGATSRTRVGSKLFGKTAQLLRDAECPILAVPMRTAARAEDEDTLPSAA
jgi:nucleotide-binding universal stress UspA family protein